MKAFKKHFPLGLAVGAVIILWSLIVGLRTADARSVMHTRLALQQQNLTDLQTKLTQLQTQQREVHELDQMCVAYQQQLPSISQSDAMIVLVKQLADVNALAMEPAKYQAASALPGIARRTARLNVRGSFNAIYAFLTQLETASPSLLVQRFELKCPGSADPDLSASVTVEMLFRTNESNTALGVVQ